MSGGSFNYLCYSENLGDLLAKKGDLEEMQKTLGGLIYADREARETQELLDLINEVEAKSKKVIENLRPVWKAVEWWRSCDYGEDDVQEAIRDHRVQKESS